jgi:hypothetical protein
MVSSTEPAWRSRQACEPEKFLRWRLSAAMAALLRARLIDAQP